MALDLTATVEAVETEAVETGNLTLAALAAVPEVLRAYADKYEEMAGDNEGLFTSTYLRGVVTMLRAEIPLAESFKDDYLGTEPDEEGIVRIGGKG